MVSNDKVTEIFFSIDEFCKVFEPAYTQRLIDDGKKHRKRDFKMSMAKILTISVIFHLSGHRTFKHFYIYYVQKHMGNGFPLFKLHLMVNDRGEVLEFVVTQANVDDRAPLKEGIFLKRYSAAFTGTRAICPRELASMLFKDGVHLVTGIRSNMKNVLMTMHDKIMLRKRSIIETINDQLKNICQAQHSRHRSFGNFIKDLVSSLIAYSFQDKKPGIKFERETQQCGQLALFC